MKTTQYQQMGYSPLTKTISTESTEVSTSLLNQEFDELKLHDQLDIATCAAEIFAKDPATLTADEQAYIIALKNYYEELNLHSQIHGGALPEYNFATATCIHVKPEAERTSKERELLADMFKEQRIRNEHRQYDTMYTPQDQVELCTEAEKLLLHKQYNQLTRLEQQYVTEILSFSSAVEVLEREHNLQLMENPLTQPIINIIRSKERG